MNGLIRPFAAPALLVLLSAQGLRAQTEDFIGVGNQGLKEWYIDYVAPTGSGFTGSLKVRGNNQPDRPLDPAHSTFTVPKKRMADLVLNRPASGSILQRFNLRDAQGRWATVEATANGPEDELHLKVVDHSAGLGDADLEKHLKLEAGYITLMGDGYKE